MFNNDLIDLNKSDHEKYKKLDRALITKSDKKTIAKQYLLNKLQGRASMSHDGRSVPAATPPKQKQQRNTHNK
jgi:hypothetical protein